MSAQSSTTFTSIGTERLFAHIGINTRLLTASQESEAIKPQRTLADLLGLSSNQWTASRSETLHESCNFTALSATHNTHNTHNMHNTHNTHDPHNAQDVSFTDNIDKEDSIRFSSRFKTLVTAGFQPTEHRTTEYVTNRMKAIEDGPGLLSDQAINWIRATEDVQQQIIDSNLSESLEQAEKFAKICDLNESLAANVNDLEATEHVQDGLSRELVAPQQEIEVLEEDVPIEKCWCGKVERRLDKCRSEPETTVRTDIAHLQLEKDMLLHQVKNLWSQKSGLESELRVFEHVIQWLTTNQVQVTPVRNTSQLPPGPLGICGSSGLTSGLFGIRASTEPTPGPSGSGGFSVKSSNLPTYEGKWTLDDVTDFLFTFEWHCKNEAQAIEWVGTTGWGEQAVPQQKGDAAVWATHRFPKSTPIEWSTFCTEL